MADVGSFVKVFVVDGLQGLDYGGQVDNLAIQHIVVESHFTVPSVVLHLDVQSVLEVCVTFLNRFAENPSDILNGKNLYIHG